MATLDYRLRIRNDDDSDDLLLYSTVPGANCFTLKAPENGDGQSIDPILGSFVLGTYTYQVIDAPIGGDTRAVSGFMADTNKRYRLISRLAIVEFSANRGSTWTGYLSGYVNQIQKLGALVYEFTIGDAQRVEKNITLFNEKSGSFDKMSCLIGGPVRGGFALIRDYGPWTMRTKGHYASKVVQFHFVSGYVRRSTGFPFLSFPTGGFAYAEGDYTNYEEQKVNKLAEPYRIVTPDFLTAGIGSHYPRLEARVESTDGTLIGFFQVLNARDPAYSVGNGWTAGDLQGILSGGDLCLDWATSGENPSTQGVDYPTQPTTGTELRIIVYALDVTDTTPVHVQGHPVDIHAQAYDDAGIAYDDSSRAATKEIIGSNLGVAIRPTKSMTLDAFTQQLMGMFGYSVRQVNGKRVFLPIRIRVDTTPELTCGINDIRDATAVIFVQNESTIINKVTVQSESYELWAPEKFGQDSERPIDELVTTPRTTSVIDSADEMALYGLHEQVYAIQGEFYLDQMFKGFLIQITTRVELASPEFTKSIALGAGSIFDRRLRGAITGELRCIRGSAGALEGAQLGDEIYCTIPWQQNVNGIGGNRIVQITSRTETPTGPIFLVEDSGTDAQPATLPTFTFVKDSSTDPKRYAIATITNVAALIAEGDNVRIELGVGASPTSYALLAVLTAADLDNDRYGLRLPRLDAGSVHTMRMRSESQGIRPSTYTSPVTCTLDALTAPSSLSIIGQAGDDTIAVVSWTPGEIDVPIEVRFRVTGATAWRSVIVPPGSVNVAIATLALNTEYDFDVRHHEKPPYDGVSSSATTTFTTGSTARQLLAPDNPSAFSGSFDPVTGSFVNDGTYGLEVTALEFPEAIQFEVAIEDSPGAGTYGAYVEPPRSVVSAGQQPSRTRWTGVASSDGLRRRLHAKAVRVGATDSAWCDPVDVLPWVPLRPTDFPVPVPDLTLSYQVIDDAGSQRAVILAQWATPQESQYEDMEYLVRQRVIGSSTWSGYSRVPGTKSGPDLIPTQFGLEVEVTLVTITHQGVRNEGTSPETIEIPAAAADGTLTVTADADTANNVVTPNSVAAAYDVFSKAYSSDPGTVDRVDDDPLNYRGPRRAATETYFELAVDGSTMKWRVTTVVFYDQNGIRGLYKTAKIVQDPAASPPSAPTLAYQSNAANAVVERVTFVTTPTAGDQIALKRGGVLLLTHTITSGEVTAGHADITDTSAVGGATYSFTAQQHRLSDGLLSLDSSADSVTVAAGGTLSTPGTPSTAIDPGDPCSSALVTPRDTSGNPSGTTYNIYGATSSGGTYTLLASGVAKNNAASVSRPGGQHASSYYKTEAHRSGYSTSAKSAAGSIGAVPPGTAC